MAKNINEGRIMDIINYLASASLEELSRNYDEQNKKLTI